jgi:protoporphyrinogen oxidase
MLNSDTPVTILGAGLAGLSAGWQLSKQGVPVRLIERDPQVGGMAKTIEKDGYRFDYGPHRFYSEDQSVLDLVRALVNDELLTHMRLSRVCLNGFYLNYPPSLPNLVRSLRLSTGLRCLLDYVNATWRRYLVQGEEPDFQSWIINRFGKQVYEINFGPYTQKVWGIPPHLLSADLAKRRVSAPNLADVIVRLLQPAKEGDSPYVTQFWYPETGIGRIAERMAEEILAMGGEIWLSHSVDGLHILEDRVVRLTLSNENGKMEIPCQKVLSTLPLPQLMHLLTPPPGQNILHAAALPYRALIYLFIMLDCPKIGDDHWLYFPEERFLFNRVSEPKTFSPNHAPNGKTSLCAEITCDLDDDIWRMPLDTLADRVINDLEVAGLIQPAEVASYFLHRCPWGYPVYQVGYADQLDLLFETIDRIVNLVTFGRQGGFDYGNMSEAMASGLKVAKQV